jgi:hypothetical protein
MQPQPDLGRDLSRSMSACQVPLGRGAIRDLVHRLLKILALNP